MDFNDMEFPERPKMLQSVVIDQVTALLILEELNTLNRTLAFIVARLDRIETKMNDNH